MRYGINVICLLTVLAISPQNHLSSLRAATVFQRIPAPDMVDVGGYRLNIDCLGKAVKRAPTVILEAGLNSSSETWNKVQPEIAKFARVCAYDRAGLGKSDPPPQQQPRTSVQMAKDLHSLLNKAAITGPLVLVGHSFGGINVRMYASLYPKDVAGMVLVDSAHEEETAKWVAMIPPELRKQMEAGGGQMLLGGEQVDLKRSQTEMTNAHWHTAIPLIVISRGKASFNPDDYPPLLRDLAPRGEELRLSMQTDLARRSSKSRHLFAEKSGHMIQQDQPELVIDAVRRVVESTRLQDRKNF